MKRLAGKVAIITGAGQGVGLGIAQAYADGGASLVISGRNANKLQGAAAELTSRGAKVTASPRRMRSHARFPAILMALNCGGI